MFPKAAHPPSLSGFLQSPHQISSPVFLSSVPASPPMSPPLYFPPMTGTSHIPSQFPSPTTVFPPLHLARSWPKLVSPPPPSWSPSIRSMTTSRPSSHPPPSRRGLSVMIPPP